MILIHSLENISKTALKKFTEKLRSQLQEYVYSFILPYFKKSLAEQFGNSAQIKASENGEQVWITYPGSTENYASYIKSHVLLEFGARNSIEPNNQHTIQPIISDSLKNIEFPQGICKCSITFKNILGKGYFNSCRMP